MFVYMLQLAMLFAVPVRLYVNVAVLVLIAVLFAGLLRFTVTCVVFVLLRLLFTLNDQLAPHAVLVASVEFMQ